MKDTTAALGFLIGRTLRNRLGRQLARVKKPRYAIALLIGVAYMVLVFANPSGARQGSVPGAAETIGTIGGIGLAVTVILWWLRGGVNTALAFQPAEVQLLFPAPLTRRPLIGYRVVRSQVLLLLNALLWVFLMRRWGVALSIPMRFVTAWGFFSVLSLHRLGAALVQVPPVRGGRRTTLIAFRGLAGAAAAALLVGVGPVLAHVGSLGMAASFKELGSALAAPPARYALAPFRLVVAPLYAASTGEWLADFAIVAVIVALHLVWVLTMNVEFEEAAATASVELAKRVAAFRERRAGGASIVAKQKAGGLRTRLPLAAVGWPATAIAWKNTLALVRTGSLRMALLLVVIIVASSRIFAATAPAHVGVAAAGPYLAIAAMTFILGPRMVRNDLRQDLLSLALLKSYPLRGRSVVAAEMASPTLVLTLFQLAMLLAGLLSIPAEARGSLLEGWTAAMLVAPFALLSLNAMNVGIQNGMALLFPSWVRLGPDSGGIEAIGQNVLVMIGSLLALAVGLILPLGGGVVARVLSVGALGDASLSLAAGVGTAVLAAEIYGLILMLGDVFERMDPGAMA